jgi:hypothetical protein
MAAMSKGQGSRWRWWVVSQLNKLPGQCWADLVPWALGSYKRGTRLERKRLPWSPIREICRGDIARTGTCYCGKIQTREFQEKYPEAAAGKVVE